MTLKTRLMKLEAPLTERWREAWAQSGAFVDKHAGGILDTMTTDTPGFLARLTAARPGATGEEVEAEAWAFLESLGVTQYRAFETWSFSYDIPEDDPPDLSLWPRDIPLPPAEPPGDWETVGPYMVSENPVEQLGAQVYMLFLAMARAVREERTLLASGKKAI